MSPGQALPSFNLALHPDHYKTVLPNLSYPSRPITHISWSGSSGPLLFSVSQTVLFFLLWHCLTFSTLRKRRVQRQQSLLVFLLFKSALYLLWFNSDTDVKTLKCWFFINSRFLLVFPPLRVYISIILLWSQELFMGLECWFGWAWLSSCTRTSSDSLSCSRNCQWSFKNSS